MIGSQDGHKINFVTNDECSAQEQADAVENERLWKALDPPRVTGYVADTLTKD